MERNARRVYTRGKTLGEGTYGVVFLATSPEQETVAIKRYKASRDMNYGLDFSAIREIKFLREIRHENIVQLLDVYIDNGSLHLVFEYCSTDLETILKSKDIFLTSAHIKHLLQSTAAALAYLHSNYILHRDLKPANIFITSKSSVKLGDFGLARTFGSPNKKMTTTVATLWYRAPELLFGAYYYSSAVDIWSLGCIFAEIMLRNPLFTGTTDIEQLSKIFNCLGTPSSSANSNTYWPGVEHLPNYLAFEPRTPMNLTPLFRSQPPQALELLLLMLTLNPNKRITAAQILLHAYLTTSPLPEKLPLPASASNNGPDTKRMRIE